MTGQIHKRFSFDELEEILIYFSSTIMEKDNEEDILWDLVRNCISKLRLIDCVIYFVDAKQGALIQKAAYGPKSSPTHQILNPIRIPIGKGITGSVALTGKAEIIPDTRRDARYILDDELRLSEIAVPIIINNKVIGVIDCEHPLPDFFTEQHLRILSAIAALLAVRLSWIRAERKVKRREQNLLKVRQEAADLKIRAIRAQMNPHFVFNAINAIQHFITTNEKKTALKYLSLFSKLLRFYLQYLEEESIRVADEVKILTWYLTLQALRYDSKFRFSVENETGDQNLRIPALVTQIFLEEQVEQLMLRRVGPNNVLVTITQRNSTVTIRIICESNSASQPIRRNATYRSDIPGWEDHVALINRVKKYKIKTTHKRIPADKSGVIKETYELVLPVVE